MLGPEPGERILEIGVGTGYYSLDLAEWVGAEGSVELFDLQREMLDHVMRRAGERGLANLAPTEGDATALPYADGSVDAVVLIAVLGETPDRAATIAQIARVLRPGGRLVVGELFGDPHFTTPRQVARLGAAAGLVLERRSGPWAGSFSLLRKPG